VGREWRISVASLSYLDRETSEIRVNMRPAPLTDGILYISQARTLQPEGERRPYFEMGYSTFLSYFEFSALTDGSKGTADPALTKVYRAESIILSASIVILLVSAFMILRGPLVLRAAARLHWAG